MMDAFVRYPVEIYYSDELSPQDKIVFGHILNEQNIHGEPLAQSAVEIGKRLNIPGSTVKDSIRKLVKLELIEVEHGRVSKYSVRTGDVQSRTRDVRQRTRDVQSRTRDVRPYTLYKRNKRNIRKEECHARAARDSLLNISREADDYSFLPLIEEVK